MRALSIKISRQVLNKTSHLALSYSTKCLLLEKDFRACFRVKNLLILIED